MVYVEVQDTNGTSIGWVTDGEIVDKLTALLGTPDVTDEEMAYA